jgi:hypothetical protein
LQTVTLLRKSSNDVGLFRLMSRLFANHWGDVSFHISVFA